MDVESHDYGDDQNGEKDRASSPEVHDADEWRGDPASDNTACSGIYDVNQSKS